VADHLTAATLLSQLILCDKPQQACTWELPDSAAQPTNALPPRQPLPNEMINPAFSSFENSMSSKIAAKSLYVLLCTGSRFIASEGFFRFSDGLLLMRNVSVMVGGALLAFSLEFSEFLLVSQNSSLTLSISAMFKASIVRCYDVIMESILVAVVVRCALL